MGSYSRELRRRIGKRHLAPLGEGSPFQRGLRFYRRCAELVPPDITATDMAAFAALVLGNVAVNTAPDDVRGQRVALGRLTKNALKLIGEGAFKRQG
jgi:hypothetical protein